MMIGHVACLPRASETEDQKCLAKEQLIKRRPCNSVSFQQKTQTDGISFDEVTSFVVIGVDILVG